MSKNKLFAYGLLMGVLMFLVSMIGDLVFKFEDFDVWGTVFRSVFFAVIMTAFRYYEVKKGWFKKI